MSAITADSPMAQNLRFAQSESKAVGFGGKFMDFLRDNAVRVVGAMTFAANLPLLGHESAFIIGCGVFNMIGKTIMFAYGSKSQQKNTKLTSADNKEMLGDDLVSSIKKTIFPKQYPIESSSALSMLANASSLVYGVGTSSVTITTGSIVSILTYGNMIIGKEKDKKDAEKEDKQSLKFGESESKPVSWIGEKLQFLKDNPVLASSLIYGALTAGIMIGSFFEEEYEVTISSAVILAATVIQGLLVKKKEFSIEGDSEQSTDPKGESFAQRESDRRSVQPEAGRTT